MSPITNEQWISLFPTRKILIIIESSFLATTSSGQGDKSKTEISIDTLIKEHYPKASFIGFVDGIGWYVRKSDLRRIGNCLRRCFYSIKKN